MHMHLWCCLKKTAFEFSDSIAKCCSCRLLFLLRAHCFYLFVLGARLILKFLTIRNIYFSSTYPYVIYGTEVRGMGSKWLINSFIVLQQLYYRIVSNSPIHTPSEPLFMSMNIMPISKLYEYSLMIYEFTFYHGYSPEFINFFPTVGAWAGTVRQSLTLHSGFCTPRRPIEREFNFDASISALWVACPKPV